MYDEKREHYIENTLQNIAIGFGVTLDVEKDFEGDSESPNVDQSFEIEIPKDDFQGIFNVFISHKFDNENKKLALILRESLRSNKIEGYLAESKGEYELLIGDKIRKEIDNCEFVVGIITKESEKSASVNQVGVCTGTWKTRNHHG
jgi:hypothetical protein